MNCDCKIVIRFLDAVILQCLSYVQGRTKQTEKMIKQELIDAVSAKSGRSEVVVRGVLDAALEVMTESLKENDQVVLRGFGTFKVKELSPRKVYNFKTRQMEISVTPRKVVFLPGENLKNV